MEDTTLLEWGNIDVPSLRIPAYTLERGLIVSLAWPHGDEFYHARISMQHVFVCALVGDQPHLAVQRRGVLSRACPVRYQPVCLGSALLHRLLEFVVRTRIKHWERDHPWWNYYEAPAWSCDKTSSRSKMRLSRDTERELREKFNIPESWLLSTLGWNTSSLIGVTLAAEGCDVLVFDTAGCDPKGAIAIYEVVSDHVKRGAAIEVSLSYSGSTKSYRHHPQADLLAVAHL